MFTLFYPVTHQGVSYDSYVASEVEKIAQSFDEVHVISMAKDHDGHIALPANLTFESCDAPLTLADKLLSLRFLLAPLFLNELQTARVKYGKPVTVALIKAILLYLAKAAKYKSVLEKQLATNDFGKTDIVIYSYWTFENALAAACLKTKYPIKVFTRMHSLDLYFDRLPENYIPYRQFIYNHSDDVFFISEQGRQYFNALHKPQNAVKGMLNRLGVISNTDKLPQPGAKLVLLSNAWIQPLKRVDLIAGALALITDIQIEWIHIGDDYGMQRFDALKAKTKDLLGARQNITYEFVGRKTQQEVYRIFEERNVNLFINVSTTEGIPVSIMEALSFGVPVIATRVGGVPEIIEDGYNGFLLDKDITAPDVANAIKNYVNLATAEKERLMQNAKTTWQQKYNVEKNSGELVARLLKAEA